MAQPYRRIIVSQSSFASGTLGRYKRAGACKSEPKTAGLGRCNICNGSKHRDILKQRFDINGYEIVVLDIEDDYQFNDPELVEMLKVALEEYL